MGLINHVRALEWNAGSCDAEIASLIRACGSSKNLGDARTLHAQIQLRETLPTVFVENLIVEMYAKCGSIADACRVFDGMRKRNVYTWTMMISAFAGTGDGTSARFCFWRMNLEGVRPDRIALLAILDSVSDIASPADMLLLQSCIEESGLGSDLILGNALLNLYSKRLIIEATVQFFQTLTVKDVITWTVLITAYARSGHPEEALDMFRRMDQEGITANAVTFVALCTAFSKLSLRHFHSLDLEARIHQSGSLRAVCCSLIEMYGKLGLVEKAVLVFEAVEQQQRRNVVAWTAVINAHAQNGNVDEAFELFERMDREQVEPDSVVFLTLLNACISSQDLHRGKLLHDRIIKLGLDSQSNLANTLITMYGKCGRVDAARDIFKKLETKSVVSWTAMMAANAQNEHTLQAFELFCRMTLEGVRPTEITLITVLDACSLRSDSLRGKLVHACVEGLGLAAGGVLGNALVNFYGKCGNTKKALSIFQSLRFKDACAWNAMVAAYAQVGQLHLALEKIQEMELEGIRAVDATFVNVLSALSHAGLLQRCCQCLVSMIHDYYVAPVGDHYRCIVDMLARLGHLRLANELMERMPFEPSATAWMSLLAASRVHQKSSSVDRVSCTAAERVFELEPENASPYLALSTIYRTNSINKND